MFAREACLPEPTGFRAALEWSARALSYGTLSAARAIHLRRILAWERGEL